MNELVAQETGLFNVFFVGCVTLFLMNIGGTQAVTNNGKLTQRAQNESQLPNQGKVTPGAQSQTLRE
jgi:hypothetical protein